MFRFMYFFDFRKLEPTPVSTDIHLVISEPGLLNSFDGCFDLRVFIPGNGISDFDFFL